MPALIDFQREPQCAQYLRTGRVRGARRSDLPLDPAGQRTPRAFPTEIETGALDTLLSSRHVLPGSSPPQTPEQTEGWIAGTSPAMTVAAELAVLPKSEPL
jgi:hypothetical protein